MELTIEKKKKGVQYFTQETENAIVAYNNAATFEEKNKINVLKNKHLAAEGLRNS